jgi:hypothetical protein
MNVVRILIVALAITGSARAEAKAFKLAGRGKGERKDSARIRWTAKRRPR